MSIKCILITYRDLDGCMQPSKKGGKKGSGRERKLDSGVGKFSCTFTVVFLYKMKKF